MNHNIYHLSSIVRNNEITAVIPIINVKIDLEIEKLNKTSFQPKRTTCLACPINKGLGVMDLNEYVGKDEEVFKILQ